MTGAIDGPLKHGARSKVMLLALTDARVDELRALIREHGARWLTEADEGLITTAARNLVVVDQMWSYIVQRGAIDGQGRTRAVMEYWARINGVLTRQLTALGLGPVARSELGANVAGAKHDLARAMRTQQRRQDEGNSPSEVGDEPAIGNGRPPRQDPSK